MFITDHVYSRLHSQHTTFIKGHICNRPLHDRPHS